ncbi:DUF2461 domain-containing protein [Jiulongibacter sediminis]|jgi:uncharacterized protein (TIGR02453 family)|uniref:DUF2461 domain-containing protein n=1 Tax=Jiulongibacter sediminis TaxID=1605367 RepID=UPI0026EF1558|nr:DUF2461 domain-containing protein [Jiulongibacter sediminis]
MQEVYAYLQKLKENNNRRWFEQHRDEYEACLEKMVEFADDLLVEMNSHDVIENPSGKKCLHRIYRDTRFSKDKTPYKKHWGGRLRRAGAYRRGSYYFHFEPGNSYLGGGFWGPNKEDLKQIRIHLAAEPSEYLEIINSKEFKAAFGEVRGEQLKTSPKDFDTDHENVELLRYKQFLLVIPLKDEDIFEPNLAARVSDNFKKMRPYFNVMSAYLTTDLNGEELI